MSRITDEQIIDLAVCHSNHKETSETGIEYEVISHRRLIEFSRALLALSAPAPSIDAVAMAAEAQFLLDRLGDLEWSGIPDEFWRDWNGHVEPSIARLRAALAPDTAARREERYQDRVAKAHTALFHDDPTDVAERLARFFEEANEACQSLGMTREDAHKLVDYTYDRPTGEPALEIGAAALTLASLCVVAGYDMEKCAEADLAKLQRPETIARIRAKRATRHGRGPLPGLSPAALEREGRE